MYDAFISYRRKTGFLMAQLVRDRLEEKGVRCFLDLEELRSGKFNEKIFDSIRDAPAFILILSGYALNGCAKEDDWLRREILCAMNENENKVIIPVTVEGFRWPKTWKDGIPEEIRALKNTNCVPGSREYLSAMIDKIISYMPSGAVSATASVASVGQEIPGDTAAFFRYALEEVGKPSTVYLAFHTGADWRRLGDKVELLSEFVGKGLKLKVLVNTAAVAESITRSMAQPFKRYIGFDASLAEWRELAAQYPGQIEVRTASVPLFRRLYLVEGEDRGFANVKYYSYGNYTPEKDFRICFASGTREYDLYKGEFEYLWNESPDR